MQDNDNRPGSQFAQLRSLADFMAEHDLTARYVTSFDRVDVGGVGRYRKVSATVGSPVELRLWAEALGVDFFTTTRVPAITKQPVWARVDGWIGPFKVQADLNVARLPRVIVPTEGEHRSPLCSLEPWADAAAEAELGERAAKALAGSGVA